MKKIFQIFIAVFFVQLSLARVAFAQEGSGENTPSAGKDVELIEKLQTRPKFDDINKESSSYVTDPDSLDPLPIKNESLKEDAEPVNEDIKSLVKNKKPSQKNLKSNDLSQKQKTTNKKTANKKSNKKSRSTQVKNKKKPKNSEVTENLENRSPDDPDLNYEAQLHEIYKKFNSSPTSDEQWGAVAQSQKEANTYIVQKGDTLFSISKTLFGDAQFWPKIWAINNQGITNPHDISPGVVIQFYPGSESAPPSLQVQKFQMANGVNGAGEGAPKAKEYERQNTEFNKLSNDISRKKETKQGDKPLYPPYSDIPPSFPRTFAGKYLNKGSSETKLIITPRAEPITQEPTNPYILTASLIVPDYKVPESESNVFICKEKQFVPSVIKTSLKAEPGRYNMVLREDFKFERLKRTYLYRVIGEVEVYSDETLRVNTCIENVNTDILLVSNETLENVRPPAEAPLNTRSQIIEGIEVYGQNYFYTDHYVIINMNQLPALENERLKLYSATAGGIVGEVKILKRTGTLAIGFVTKADDVVQYGDRIIVPEGVRE